MEPKREITIALQLAKQEAERLGRTEFGTEHLLVGLLKGPGAAKGILEKAGVSLRLVRDEIDRLRGNLGC